jgi:16S rRNA (adenine1518-N6/adenine1519-N6)-dimethyltransferase
MALERAARADAHIAFEVPARAFRPRPKVTSAVVVLRLHRPTMEDARLEAGLKLAAHALTKPRKKLANALRPLRDADRIAAADLDPALRPSKLSLDDWIRLAAIED